MTRGYKRVPNISFQGDWLKQYGFDAGTLISVICEDGKLTIVPREADPMNPEIQECLDQLESMSKKKIHLLEQSLEIHKNRKKQ